MRVGDALHATGFVRPSLSASLLAVRNAIAATRIGLSAKLEFDARIAIDGGRPIVTASLLAVQSATAEAGIGSWARTYIVARIVIEHARSRHVPTQRHAVAASRHPAEGTQLMPDWPTLTLHEAGVRLIDCVHKTPARVDNGLPYITIPGMKEGRLSLADARRISEADFAEWTKKALPQGYDVVLSRRCNPGETAVVEPDAKFALGQNLVLLRADGSKVHPPFLRWLVRGPQWWDQVQTFLNVGAVFDSLRCADVPGFQLSIPPLDEQRAIAEVLGSLDDKIELNRRMNRALEEMAAAIFKAWFVDFEPVKAKAAGATSFPAWRG